MEQKADYFARVDRAIELDHRFSYHEPTPDKTQRYELIRRSALNLVGLLTSECPESRELSLAITKIEEAVFWANASIARNEVEVE